MAKKVKSLVEEDKKIYGTVPPPTNPKIVQPIDPSTAVPEINRNPNPAIVNPFYNEQTQNNTPQNVAPSLNPNDIAESQFDETTTNILGPGTLRLDYQANLAAKKASEINNTIAPPLSEYDQAKQDYLNTLKQKPNKQGRAAQVAFQVFQAMENFGRALQGQPLNEFQWLGEAKKGMRDQQAARRFAPYLQQHQMDVQEAQQTAELRAKQVKALEDQAKAQTAILESIRARNPKFYESLEKRGYITQEDAKFAEENGYGKLAVGDFRKRETKQIDETTYERPEIGNEPWSKSTLPTEKSKQVIQRTLPDGTPYFTTGDKEADRIAQQQYRQAQLDFEAGKFNAQQLQQYQDDLQRWSQDESKRQQSVNEWTTQMGVSSKEAQSKREEAASIRSKLNDTMKEENPSEYYKLQREADKLDSEAKVSQSKSDELYYQVQRSKSAPMPVKPAANLKAPNITEKVMSKAEYNAAVKKFGQTKADKLVKDGGWTIK